MKTDMKPPLVYDAINTAFLKSGWTRLRLAERANEFGTYNFDNIYKYLDKKDRSDERRQPLETSLSLLLCALDLRVYAEDGTDLTQFVPVLPESKRRMRQEETITEPENRLLFNAIYNAWKQTYDEEANKEWSLSRLKDECLKYGRMTYSSLYNFLTGQGNMREEKVDTLLQTLRLYVLPLKR